MMRELQIPLLGSHHLGIDDTKNIARVVQHMLIDGALLQITARRLRGSPEKVGVYWRHLVPFSKCGFQNLSLRNMELLMFKENTCKVLYWCRQLSH
ncbi:unnamed protein product [Coffea canephora]|uniref:Exonuclease domain-containing protein n=1 Tax=Coffea canephora TaxID=49390 RepID=A0A068UVW2_COFCA|nr:unnamed protein product [Coffea canephora]